MVGATRLVTERLFERNAEIADRHRTPNSEGGVEGGIIPDYIVLILVSCCENCIICLRNI